MTHCSPTTRFRLAGRIFACLIVGLVVAGCNTASKPQLEQRPTSFWPPAPDEPRIQFLHSFFQSTDVTPAKAGLEKVILGTQPENAIEIAKPYGIKIWQGKIYVCDVKLKAVLVLDLRKKLVRTMGTTGTDALQNPADICIAPEGTKYVADSLGNKVVVFDASDKQIGVFTHSNFKPVGVAVYGDELAVADFAMQRVEIMDRSTGKVRRTIGSPGMKDGQFIRPLAVAYEANGNLVVSDFMKCRIQKFDRSGKLINAMGNISTGIADFVRPKHIAIDREGMLYVVDAAFQNVQVFGADWIVRTFFGTAGTHPGSMQLPAGITVDDDPQNMELFREYLHPAFEPQRLILVTNQFGPNRVAVYALGKLKPGLTVADISPSRIKIPVAATQATTEPTTLPTTLPTEDLPASLQPPKDNKKSNP